MKRILCLTKSCFSSFILIIVLGNVYGQVKLPKLFSDGMVLQRGTELDIWGWASLGENVSVKFKGSVYQTKADENGKWEITLPALKAGGPYTMEIKAKNTITLKNILVGDVWVCSGQSNMEMRMKRVKDIYKKEISCSYNPNIRSFTVPQEYYFSNPEEYNFSAPLKDVKNGSWMEANPENVLNFSATAYFFARSLYEKHKVPIGIINSSLGGAPAEAFMSEEAIKAFPNYTEELQKFKDTTYTGNLQRTEKAKSDKWHSEVRKKDEGLSNPQQPWFAPETNTSSWETTKIPGYFANTPLGPVNGVIWFRRTFNVPEGLAQKPALLKMGTIIDADSVFINGKFVGTTSFMYPPREYPVGENILKAGENTIVVRIISNSGKGGFILDKPYELILGEQSIDLKGKWKYKLGVKMEPLPSSTSVRMKPVGLYNSMINPLISYRIKGVAWYQGESNISKAIEYRSLFPTLINDWRKKWNQGDFPFVFVQLPNFLEPQSQPSESGWAMFREAQTHALALPNTGMAVTLELGEWNDVHPVNKQEVGARLALVAEKVAYGENTLVYSGPVYESIKIDGHKIVLSFNHVGSGLISKNSEKLNYFAIAGANKKFVWAKAKIENNKILVWSDDVPNPVAVRYAWADNPDGANLYNKEDLPAAPFRTDNW